MESHWEQIGTRFISKQDIGRTKSFMHLNDEAQWDPYSFGTNFWSPLMFVIPLLLTFQMDNVAKSIMRDWIMKLTKSHDGNNSTDEAMYFRWLSSLLGLPRCLRHRYVPCAPESSRLCKLKSFWLYDSLSWHSRRNMNMYVHIWRKIL